MIDTAARRRRPRVPRPVVVAALACALAAATGLVGCKKDNPNASVLDQIPSRYPDLGPKTGVPPYMAGTVFSFVELTNTEPYAVSGYGLVGRLRGTGDSTAPTPVREWMLREMARRGFGNSQLPGYGSISGATVMSHPDFAIVEVHAYVPPGARQGDWIDAHVRALPRNRTTSLSHGVLFETDLKLRGADPQNPGLAVDVLARAKGSIIVNPVYALASPEAQQTAAAKTSLRHGVVMFNTRVMADRPLRLQLRQPQRSVARSLERRINEFFQHVADHPKKTGGGAVVAEAQDEGIIELYVPRSFKGDWEHLAGVAQNLFVNNSSAFAANKAKELAGAALQPDAPLMDISYAWEGLGAAALPHIGPLMTSPRPDVAFAAARAATFIGDPSGAANSTLVRIASTRNHPFQLAAIQTLGALPPSSAVNQMLRGLVNSPQATVRIEAYKVLVANGDSAVFTRWIEDPHLIHPDEDLLAGVNKKANEKPKHEEKFALDIVPSNGPPIIYATRRGVPRIAIIGPTPTVALPAIFTAMEQRFMITSRATERTVQLFFRDERFMREPLRATSKPDVAEIIARLGGEGPVEERRFNFTYGEIVAIVRQLVEEHKLEVVRPNGGLTLASFLMQEAPRMQDDLYNVPVIGDQRPQADAGTTTVPGTIPGIGAADAGLAPVGDGSRPQ